MKGFQQAFTGNNYITGEHLSAGDRWGEGIGATLSIIPIPGLKHAGKYGTKDVIWADLKLKKVVTESAVATPLKSKFSLKLNLQLFGSAGKPEDTFDLFRVVGPDEFYDIMDNRLFRPGPYSFDGKQFGYNFNEVLQLTDFLKDSSAIIKVKLLKSVIDELDHTPVDKKRYSQISMIYLINLLLR